MKHSPLPSTICIINHYQRSIRAQFYRYRSLMSAGLSARITTVCIETALHQCTSGLMAHKLGLSQRSKDAQPITQSRLTTRGRVIGVMAQIRPKPVCFRNQVLKDWRNSVDRQNVNLDASVTVHKRFEGDTFRECMTVALTCKCRVGKLLELYERRIIRNCYYIF